jgi:hypothetical protein
VNLPESIAHLSSLKSLDLSDWKRLECIPQLPPYINQLLTFDCPSIKRMMSNSISTRLNLNLPSDSNETSSTFKFHFTYSQEMDASAHSNISFVFLEMQFLVGSLIVVRDTRWQRKKSL